MSPEESEMLRLAFTEARRAREHGNHPFGAVLANAEGRPLMGAENSVITHRDVTAHAELNLLRAASRKYALAELASCTLYASAEPCPMCASAMVWGNIRRVVFGLGMQKLYNSFGDIGDAPALKMESREIFRAAPWPIEVHGPVLEEEALVPHEGFWTSL